MLVPKLFTCLKGYTKDQFIKDCIAGIIVAIIALPLAIALAISSGVSPEKGLYTAIIGGVIVSFLGGSRVQIGGPTGAFVIIVYGIIQKYGMDGLIISTIMAGCFLVIMGLLKLGSLIKYIPSSITSGFTSGIAIVIFSTQIKDFFGLQIKSVPTEFLHKWMVYIQNLHKTNYQSLFIGVLTLGIIILWPKINKKIPGTFIAIIISTIITLIFKFNITTIGSQFGQLSSAFPKFNMPHISFKMINELMLPAVTIAILAGVESLLSAVVSDGMIGGNHRSNMELVAQGVANVFSGIFGGIPVTGAIARTAANVKNGGRTPIAGLVHAISLLIIMFIFMPYVKLIPMASLAAVLIMVSYNMAEWESFKQIPKAPKSDALIFIVTFLLTIFCDLVVAICVGVVLSSFLFMKKMAEITDVKCVLEDIKDNKLKDDIEDITISDEISIYEISGPFFFGAANKFISAVKEMGKPSKVLILKMEKVPFMDATAYHSFEMLYNICKKYHTQIILVDLQEQPIKMLNKYGFIKLIGEENLYLKTEEAIKKANSLIAK